MSILLDALEACGKQLPTTSWEAVTEAAENHTPVAYLGLTARVTALLDHPDSPETLIVLQEEADFQRLLTQIIDDTSLVFRIFAVSRYDLREWLEQKAEEVEKTRDLVADHWW